MEEIKCKYIYKKGIYKDQICNKINCKIHNKSHNKKLITHKNTHTQTNEKPLSNSVVTVSVTIPQDHKNTKINNPDNNTTITNITKNISKNITKKTSNIKLQDQNVLDDEKIILKNKILECDTTLENKFVMMKHYKNMIKSESDSSEYYKNKQFIESCVDIPWNKYYDTFKHIHQNKEYIKIFIQNLKDELDKNIYGMDNVKNEIINHICKFITNPTSTRNNLALYGSAGVCKTRFIKVLSNLLNLPMQIISLGGVRDASYLLGHNYTYMESKCGSIVQNIIDSNMMNPILYFDELDKVSQTEQGQDIYSVLSHLTDESLNANFSDHYLHGIKIDLSQVFYIFTFNDISKINKVLLDRLNIIYVDSPSKSDKIVILKDYCISPIIENIGININIVFDTDCFNMVIDYVDQQIDVSMSSGIRESIRIFEKILLEMNKEILLECDEITDNLFIDSNTFKTYFNKMKKQFFFLNNHKSDIPFSMYI